MKKQMKKHMIVVLGAMLGVFGAVNAVADEGNVAIWRTTLDVGSAVDFAGRSWRISRRDSTTCSFITTDSIDRMAFSIDRDDPDYANSDIRRRVNSYEQDLRAYSGPQMTWTEIDGNGLGYIKKHNLSDVIKGEYDDFLYLMSLNEAKAMGTSTLAKDILNMGDMWYLRTPGTENNGNACVVIKGGYISDFGTKAHIQQYVRPSLDVALASPLFKQYFFRTYGDGSGKVTKSDAQIGQGFAFGNGDENAGSEGPYKETLRSSAIAAPEEMHFSQPSGWVIGVPADLSEGDILQLEDSMPVSRYAPVVNYRSSAIAEGKAAHLAVVAARSDGTLVDYAKVSAASEAENVAIPFGKLPQGSYVLSFFAERCTDGTTDYCSQEVGGFSVVNGSDSSKSGDWPASVSNRPFTVAANGVGIRFPAGVGFVQSFEVGAKGATFDGLGAGGGRIDGKVTVDAAELSVTNMTMSNLAVTNGGVLNVTGKLAIASPDETLVDGSIALSAGSVLDVKGGRCVVKNVSGNGVVTNSVPEGADTAALVITDRLTVDVARTDTLSAKVPLTLGPDFEVFVTNATDDIGKAWTIMTASRIDSKPEQIRVVADDATTGPWEVKIVPLPDDGGSAFVLTNTAKYVHVAVGQTEHLSAAWTYGDGAVTNAITGAGFKVRWGTENVKVVYSLNYGYRFAADEETGVRFLESPIREDCTITPPEVERMPFAVTFTVDASIARAAYVVESVTNELSVGSNRVDVLFGSVVELIVEEQPKHYPYAGPFSFTVTEREMAIAIAAEPIPKGMEGNPFQIGADVFAYTNTEGVLTITGTGAMSDFATAAAVPWVPATVTAVTVGAGVTQIGANAWSGMEDSVAINGTALSTVRYLAPGVGTSQPSGAISGADFETVQIVDGKAYLGVSIATNSDITAAIDGWGTAKLDPAAVEQAEDGKGLVIPVPATSEKGFMILKSKPAK